MEVFELSFMTNSAEAGGSAAWEYLQKHGLKEFPGTKILATWVHDEGYVADLKKVIDNNSGAALSRQIGKIWDESQAVGRKAAADRGNTIMTLSLAETDNWIKASASLNDEWVADMDKRGL